MGRNRPIRKVFLGFMVNFYFFRFMSFSHYAIPRENLLNKGADVTPSGEYTSPYKVVLYPYVV